MRVAQLSNVFLGITAALSAITGETTEFLKVSEEAEGMNQPLEPFLAQLPLWPAQWPNRRTDVETNSTGYEWTRVAGELTDE